MNHLYPHFRFDAAGNIVADTERGMVLIMRRDQAPNHFAPCETRERSHDLETVDAPENVSADESDELHPPVRASTAPALRICNE